MFNNLWNLIFIDPILNVLVLFYKYTGNLGVAIILLTILIRVVLYPAMVPSLKAMKKQRELQPEIDKLKKKYGYDKKKLAEEQMKLFKEHGIGPGFGCLTQLGTIVVIIALYQVISKFALHYDAGAINAVLYFDFLKLSLTESINTSLGYLNMSKPDPYFILAVLSGLTQFVQSKMTFPYVNQAEKAAEKTPDKTDDIAYNMQQQMLYTMPVMNFIIGLSLPSGVVLYILTTTVFSIVQTYFVSGLGGIAPWIKKAGLAKYIK